MGRGLGRGVRAEGRAFARTQRGRERAGRVALEKDGNKGGGRDRSALPGLGRKGGARKGREQGGRTRSFCAPRTRGSIARASFARGLVRAGHNSRAGSHPREPQLVCGATSAQAPFARGLIHAGHNSRAGPHPHGPHSGRVGLVRPTRTRTRGAIGASPIRSSPNDARIRTRTRTPSSIQAFKPFKPFMRAPRQRTAPPPPP